MCDWVCRKSLLRYSTAATTDHPPPFFCVRACAHMLTRLFVWQVPTFAVPTLMDALCTAMERMFPMQKRWASSIDCTHNNTRSSLCFYRSTFVCTAAAVCLIPVCPVTARMAVIKSGHERYPHLHSVREKK